MISPFISNMIFICGFTRGGTSWLRRSLCEHPDLTIVPGEVVFSRVKPLTRRAVVSMFSEHFADNKIEFSENKTYVNKAPGNAFVLKDLAQLMPEARFIFICRDIRDVITSYRQSTIKWMNGPNAEIDSLLTHQAKRLNGYLDSTYLPNVNFIRYEHLHRRFDLSMGELLRVLRLSAESEIIKHMWSDSLFRNTFRHGLEPAPELGLRQGCTLEWRRVLETEEIKALVNVDNGIRTTCDWEGALPASYMPGLSPAVSIEREVSLMAKSVIPSVVLGTVSSTNSSGEEHSFTLKTSTPSSISHITLNSYGSGVFIPVLKLAEDPVSEVAVSAPRSLAHHLLDETSEYPIYAQAELDEFSR